jgi:3-hydroxymyristoyl/3-hydroxydecanoyl-(acyl carrier protein) dehydratase
VRADGDPQVAALLAAAARRPMIEPGRPVATVSFERREIEALLPHREPFLLIDRVTHLDRATATIACASGAHRLASVCAGHFPGRPLMPGVLQVEAIGQAGLCLIRMLDGGDRGAIPRFALTQILGAEFVHSVTPAGDLQVVARVFSDGLFNILVGQCLQQGKVCSAAAVRGISEEHHE